MGLFGDVYDGVAGAADDAAGGLDEAVGEATSGVDWAQEGGEAAGSVFGPIGSVVGGAVGETTADNAQETVEFIDGLTTPSRDDNVLTGGARDAYDWMFDYSGEWGGMEDQHDIVGPSVDPRGLVTGSGINLIDWRSDQSQEQDPTSPQNLPIDYKWLIYGAIALGVLYVAAPALELGAAVAEEGQ